MNIKKVTLTDIAECVAINVMFVSTLVFLWCQI